MMDNKEWRNKKIEELLFKAVHSDVTAEISEADVIQAKKLVKQNARSTHEFFVIFASLNLLNAAIKRPQYKKKLHYSEIKGNVSRLLQHLITLDFNEYNVAFYINPSEKCAYLEIYTIQFSFHNILMSEAIEAFMHSDLNKVKAWKEIRLQKIAGELFELSMLNQLMITHSPISDITQPKNQAF